jgi:serine/threonine-protein kinase
MTTLPRKAGRYELQNEIGRGAMGVVYKALDPLIGRTVAVKIMRLDELAGGTPRPELLARFHTETRAAGLLIHPNIVIAYDAGSGDVPSDVPSDAPGNDPGAVPNKVSSEVPNHHLFYITMEYVPGRSLLAMMEERQTFPLPRLLRIMEQACSALDYAHQHNIIHRDVKPANILLGELDTVKITDFGTAKILELGATETGHIIGTPSYMSPEQVKGRPVDARTDVFSLGVILYELVTGEKPFPGKNVTTVIYKIVNEDPIPPIVRDASIHPGLNAVINKALAKQPEERYQSCGELFTALRNYREALVGQAPTLTTRPPASTLSRLPSASLASRGTLPSLPAATTPAAPLVSSRRRHPMPPQTKKSGQVWLALLVFIILGTVGYFSWPQIRDLLQRSGLILREEPAAPQPAPAPRPAP